MSSAALVQGIVISAVVLLAVNLRERRQKQGGKHT